MNYTEFLSGRGTDDLGRNIKEILGYHKPTLEFRHDYIQRVFPLREESHYSKVEPITDEDIAAFKQDPQAQSWVRTMYHKMLRFWNIDGFKVTRWTFEAPFRHWNYAGNHNHLRMTRVLKSLRLLGMDREAKDFTKRLRHLIEHRKDEPIHLSDDTVRIWSELVYDKENENEET